MYVHIVASGPEPGGRHEPIGARRTSGIECVPEAKRMHATNSETDSPNTGMRQGSGISGVGKVPGTNEILEATKAPENNVMPEVRRAPAIQRDPGAWMA